MKTTKMQLIPKILLSLICLGSAGIASAELITIDLRAASNGNTNLGMGPISFGGGLLEVGAWYSMGSSWDEDDVIQNQNGLGTGLGNNSVGNDISDVEWQFLSLFATAGRIVEIGVSRFADPEVLFVDAGDTYDFDNNGAYETLGYFTAGPGLDLIDVSGLTLPYIYVNAQRGTAATAFRLAQVTIEVEVPEPGTLALLGLGLAGLGFQLRKKKA